MSKACQSGVQETATRKRHVFSDFQTPSTARGEGGVNRRNLYQSGKGVSFFLTKPRPKRVNGVFVCWTQELAGFCFVNKTLFKKIKETPFPLWYK